MLGAARSLRSRNARRAGGDDRSRRGEGGHDLGNKLRLVDSGARAALWRPEFAVEVNILGPEAALIQDAGHNGAHRAALLPIERVLPLVKIADHLDHEGSVL